MPTVTAADEAPSICSQNAAYSPTIMAAQIRSAKAQAESGNPATVTVRRASCTRLTVTSLRASLFEPDLADINRHHQHLQDRPPIGSARKGAALGRQTHAVRLHV